MDTEWINTRITNTKTAIEAYEAAITTFANDDAIVSYTLDTGQSRQVVTRNDIASLNRTLDSLYVRLEMLQARINGAATLAIPGF